MISEMIVWLEYGAHLREGISQNKRTTERLKTEFCKAGANVAVARASRTLRVFATCGAVLRNTYMYKYDMS